MAAGAHNDVPFVIGSNAGEFELFVPPTTVMSCNQYEENVATMFPAFSAGVLEQYPCANYPNARLALTDLQTDMFFTCPTRIAARAAVSGGSSVVHRYYFTHGRTLGPLAVFRAAHAMEIPFVFGSVGKNGDIATPAEMRLSENMQAYWASFAADGDPNPIGATDWQPYVAARDNAIVLDEEISGTEQIKRAQCDFWEGVLAY
jgi:para-nitrobenzyl esterase